MLFLKELVATDGLYFFTTIKQSIDPRACRIRHLQTRPADVLCFGHADAKTFSAARTIAPMRALQIHL